MRGDLKDRIGRRVHDPLPGRDVLVAVALQHVGSARHDIADDAPSGRARELADHFLRKSVRIGGKRNIDVNAGNLPMASGAILPRRRGTHAAPRTRGVAATSHALERFDVAEAQAFQPRQIQTAAGAGDVAKGVAASIAIVGGIRRCADSHSIQNYDCGAFQLLAPV